MPPRPWAVALVVIVVAAVILSAVAPFDFPTWALEVSPVFIGLTIALFTYRRFPMTPLLCTLLTFHAVLLCIGAHYTYAKVPPGLWVQDFFEMSRNHYDRFCHFVQGVVPAILTREILIRRSPLTHSKWLFFLTVSVCLAFSAFYELLEWWTALIFGEGASAFLGTQGDEWDAQWDMVLCLVGAIVALVLLGTWHRKQIEKIDVSVRLI